ncbi:MAG TPA: transposase, partial [Pirellulaceae bacterium]|nr:transposase [Pirellulaceae bacterium]
MPFELFDPDGALRITEGNLPHWYQPGATYFITWRTADSLPNEVADLWYRRRNDWLLRQGINSRAKNWQAALRRLPDRLQHEFHATFSREFLEHLDQGHGACVLRRGELAQIVANSLRHFDGERYLLGDFVVMPNHIHLLVGLLGATEVEAQCYSWKKFTATQINHELQQTGEFWQPESFDHLVRSPEQFERFRRYIAENGSSAGL